MECELNFCIPRQNRCVLLVFVVMSKQSFRGHFSSCPLPNPPIHTCVVKSKRDCKAYPIDDPILEVHTRLGEGISHERVLQCIISHSKFMLATQKVG